MHFPLHHKFTKSNDRVTLIQRPGSVFRSRIRLEVEEKINKLEMQRKNVVCSHREKELKPNFTARDQNSK